MMKLKADLKKNSSVIVTFQEAETQNEIPYFSLAEVGAIKKLGTILKGGQCILPDGKNIWN